MEKPDHEARDEEANAQYLEVNPKAEHGADSPLPTPVSTPAPKSSKPRIPITVIIPVWIVLSSAVIIYNNYLYNTLNFKFPVFLVTFHLTFAVRAHVSILAYLRRTPSEFFCDERALISPFSSRHLLPVGPS